MSMPGSFYHLCLASRLDVGMITLKGITKMMPHLHNKAKQLIIDQHPYKQFPYSDKYGSIRIGYGRDLQIRGLSTSESLYLADDDINYYHSKLSRYLKFYNKLSDTRKIILVALSHKMGVQNLLNQTELMLALECQNYERASQELTNSLDEERLGYIMRENQL